MTHLLTQLDPMVLVALVGLVGVVIGHLISGWGKKADHELAALKTTVDALMLRVDDLQGEVVELRGEVRDAEKSRRLAWEKYSAAIAYLRVLAIRLTSVGATVPDPPELIAPDLTLRD